MTKIFVAVVAALSAAGAVSAQLTETFPDPLGQWTSGWLYQNSNLANYYVASGNCDENYRGNNPNGLWIADTQGCGTGVGGPCDIYFNPSFAATISSLSFGIEPFTNGSVDIFDKDGNFLNSTPFGGYDGNFDHASVVSVSSGNGVGRIYFNFAGAEGNTSVDNWEVNQVPAPGAAGLLGVAGLLAGRRRR